MKHFGCLSAIFIAILLAAAPLIAQDSESRPDTGIVYGDQYVNSYFGFSYRFPSAWSASATRASLPTLFSATPSGGDGRLIAIQAQQLWQNGNIKTGKDFLAMSVGMLAGPATGFDALPGDKHYIFGSKDFDRIDLKSRATAGNIVIREAWVATVIRGYALTFEFKAANDGDLEDLVNTMLSVSFLDSGSQASSAPVSRSASQPAVAPGSLPANSVPVAASSPARIATQPAPPSTPAMNPAASVSTPVASRPATNLPSTTSTSAARNIQPVTSAPSNALPQSSSAHQPASASAPANVPSTLINMAAVPHTIPGDTLPSTQLEPPPQPLVKAQPKPDPTTKTAVMQAVMPAPSATLSPAALNTTANTNQPAVAASAPAAVAPAATSQTAAEVSRTPVRQPGFTVQTEITRVQVSGDTLESYVIHKAPAVYPVLARQARIEGLVVLSIVVNEKGEVQDVKAISGPPLLARSAEDALRHWRFKPIIIDGKPTAVESKVSMNFQFPH